MSENKNNEQVYNIISDNTPDFIKNENNNTKKEELIKEIQKKKEESSINLADIANKNNENEAIQNNNIPNNNNFTNQGMYDISSLSSDDEDVESDFLKDDNEISYADNSSVVSNDFDSEINNINRKYEEINKETEKKISEDSFEYTDDEKFVSESDKAFQKDALKEARDSEKYYYKSFNNNQINQGVNANTDFLKNITVDLNNVEITTKSALNAQEDMDLIFDTTKSTFTVVCCQSGYSASLSGLTLAQKNAINNSEDDAFKSRQRLYKIIYNLIQRMNIPKPNFDEWLKITSFGDLNTLLFAIYCQTFVDNNDFDITCGNCNKVTSVTINNQSLVEARDKSVYAKIDEVIFNTKDPAEIVNTSIVHKNNRIMLNESKIIFDICTPSLYDHLALLKKANPKTIAEYAEAFSSMLFISHVYMPDLRASYQQNKPVYYEITSSPSILNILLNLSNSDGEQLENAIEDKLSKYQITYEIHNATCMHCNKKLPNIPVDIETILFTRINRQRKADSQ